MNITEVRIKLLKRDAAKIKAIASITIDNCFVVHDIKIIQGNRPEGEYFVAMPSKKMPDGEFRDIVHPLNSETREVVLQAILAEYEQARARYAPEPESNTS
ncbi:MAG: septation regulator SpoVG [Firmicutes bacterium]|nr:septation regulator SpoVG [Bacillota bacterium]